MPQLTWYGKPGQILNILCVGGGQKHLHRQRVKLIFALEASFTSICDHQKGRIFGALALTRKLFHSRESYGQIALLMKRAMWFLLITMVWVIYQWNLR